MAWFADRTPRRGGRCASLVLGLALVLWSTIGWAQSAWEMASEASEHMENANYPAALVGIAALEAAYPGHPAAEFARGKYLFHQGDYDAAVASLDRSLEGARVPAVQTLRDLVASTRDVVRDYATYVTPDGLFEIRYDARRDEVLIPWAAETLEAAWYEIGYDLGYWPEPPIRVEIYPRSETLAQVSSLSAEAVATSGTIALCKYNKLMFTSPRATVRGYAWRDTLSHEYVHYVVSHLTRRDLPIWLHEALAKYLERRWTGERTMRMTPSREGLLSRRIEADSLITFQQMHPSMAYLPSAEDASTAYAQVFTIMEYVVQRRGSGAIRQLMIRLRDGEELEDAFASTFGERFDVFERSWMRYLRSRPRVEVPGDFHEEIELRGAIRDAAAEGSEADDDLRSVEGRDRLRLGELLRARGHLEAALVEYERARAAIPEGHPTLGNAMARVMLDLEDYEGALAAVRDVVRWHPEIYRGHLLTGEAWVRLGRWEEARAPLEEALGINPFDPDVHRWLAALWDGLGETERADLARSQLQSVQRR